MSSKFRFLTLTLFTGLLLNNLLFAQTKLSRQTSKGQITRQEYESLLPWANSVARTIRDLIKESQELTPFEQKSFLQKELLRVVSQVKRDDRRYHSLMLSILKKSLMLSRMIERYSQENFNTLDRSTIITIRNQRDQAQIHTLLSGAKLALKYYQSDKEFLDRVSKGRNESLIFAKMGIEMANMNIKNVAQVNDSQAQYMYLRTSFSVLSQDLAQDQDSKNYAGVIVKIYRALKYLPESPSADDQTNIANIRKLYVLLDRVKNELPNFCKNDSCTVSIAAKTVKEFEIQSTNHVECGHNLYKTTSDTSLLQGIQICKDHSFNMIKCGHKLYKETNQRIPFITAIEFCENHNTQMIQCGFGLYNTVANVNLDEGIKICEEHSPKMIDCGHDLSFKTRGLSLQKGIEICEDNAKSK